MVTAHTSRLAGHRLAADALAGDPAEIVVERLDPASPLTAWLDLLDQPWRIDAACRGTPVGWWFPSKGRVDPRPRQLCATCPVRAECLAEALSRPPGEDFGIRGGTSVKERKALRAGGSRP